MSQSDFSGPRPSVEEVMKLVRSYGNARDFEGLAHEEASREAKVRAAVASLEKSPETLRKLDEEQVKRVMAEANGKWQEGFRPRHAKGGPMLFLEYLADAICSTFGAPQDGTPLKEFTGDDDHGPCPQGCRCDRCRKKGSSV